MLETLAANESLTARAQSIIMDETRVRQIVAEMLYAERMARRAALLKEIDSLERLLEICPRTAELRRAARREERPLSFG